jgi:hypothetical protein
LGKEGKKKEKRKNIRGKQGGGAEPPRKGPAQEIGKRRKKERIFAGSRAEGRSPPERAQEIQIRNWEKKEKIKNIRGKQGWGAEPPRKCPGNSCQCFPFI